MSLRRFSPPLHLLRAFSTVRRFGGVSRAAEALELTQSAVSKQIRELEDWIGVPLFERTRNRLVLTPAGERYEDAVRAVLARLEAATLELVASDDGVGSLRLASVPTFAAKWLVPRLPAFQQLHPEVTLHFAPYAQGFDAASTDADCAILFGDGHWPWAQAHYLAGNEVALIAPRTRVADWTLAAPSDVRRHTLLRHVTVPDAWVRWGEAQGIGGAGLPAGPQFDQFETLIRAVVAGMGLALVPRCLVQDEIAAGLVREPLRDGGYRSPLGYWLCYPEARSRLRPLVCFREWLLAGPADPARGAQPAAST